MLLLNDIYHISIAYASTKLTKLLKNFNLPTQIFKLFIVISPITAQYRAPLKK